MGVDNRKLDDLLKEIEPYSARLVAVSKTKPTSDILNMYEYGQLDFGENYVNELVSKYEELPKAIHWHYIGHLQSNKIKYIAPFVHLIHGVDSSKLLGEISKIAVRQNRELEVLLQVHIATEETKFGFSASDCEELYVNHLLNPLPNVKIRGLMGMASFTEDENLIRTEFKSLSKLFSFLKKQTESKSFSHFDTLSMGMSSDYKIALEEGSTMIRIGSMLFGERGKA